MASPVLAVLVELPLAVPFEQFVTIFDLEMQCLLTQHGGLVGLKKGRRVEDDPSKASAIFLVLWQNIAANNQFLDSEAAMRMNEHLQPLVRGPTTVTRWQFVGAESMDYIPYTNFRKFKMPASSCAKISETMGPLAWLGSTKGFNVMAHCVDQCSENEGCHPCEHDTCARESEGLVMLSLNGLSPSSIASRTVYPEKGAKLLTSFTVEWVNSIRSSASSERSSPESGKDTPPRLVSRESSGSDTRSYWDTILGDAR